MFKVSHSAKGKYSHCGKLYKLHYIDKIRPTGTTSSLLFGSALDAACEHYMLNRNAELMRREFKEKWSEGEINGVKTDLQTCTEIEFHRNDFDHELLTESDNQSILENTVYETVSDLVKAGEDKERIAYSNWISLYRKGRLMMEAFRNWVDENVEECLGAQTEIELEDEEGNIVTGKADFIIKIFGYDKPILVDLKTAARPYDRNSVKESEQLALYYLYLKGTKFPEMERAAYLVLNKQIKKNRTKTCLKCGTVTTGREQTCAVGDKKNRCHGDFSIDIQPECVVQYIHDEISDEFIEQNVQSFNSFVENLEAEKFEENWEGCNNYYGRPCPYFEFCRNGDMTGLCKKEDKNE